MCERAGPPRRPWEGREGGRGLDRHFTGHRHPGPLVLSNILVNTPDSGCVSACHRANRGLTGLITLKNIGPLALTGLMYKIGEIKRTSGICVRVIVAGIICVHICAECDCVDSGQG